MPASLYKSRTFRENKEQSKKERACNIEPWRKKNKEETESEREIDQERERERERERDQRSRHMENEKR